MYVYASTSHGEVTVVTKRLTYVLIVMAVIVLIACFVLTAGCLGSKRGAPQQKVSERMFINGTVEDIEYVPVIYPYGTFVTYKISFNDGRILVIGTGDGKFMGYEKIGTQILIEKVRKGSHCSMTFQYTEREADWETPSAKYWNLIDVEI